MPMFAFPAGQYFSVIGSIRASAGGRTRMALLRHRLIQGQANIPIPLVTFDAVANYGPIREHVQAAGLVLPTSQIINMHEWLRDHRHPDDPSRTPAAPEPGFTVEETYDGTPQGTPWRIFVEGAHSGENHWDYLRADGTRYLRTPADSSLGTTLVLDHQERIVADHDGLGDLWRWWLLQLIAPEGPVFLISDSHIAAFELGFLDNPRVHLLHQMHTPHHGAARGWNSPVPQDHQLVMESVGNLDALSVLTQRQAHDIELAYGTRNNIVVIPNATEIVAEPDPRPKREHGRIVVVAQLEPQKRVDLAISAFAIVAAKNAIARLDIYGDGPDREALEAQVTAAGLEERVTLHGHDTRAAEQFWTAAIGWLTSSFEGFPLALLEGRVRGCPFVSFDIPYGPAEQIRDGVDGCLVPAGDVEALADVTLGLLADSEQLEAMREPARQGALVHGYATQIELWAAACQQVQERKPHRTHISRAHLTQSQVQLQGAHPQIRGVIQLTGSGDRSELRVRWQIWLPESPAPVDLPLEFHVDGDQIQIEGRANSNDIPFDAGDPRATSRLLIEWGNSTYAIPVVARKPVSPAQRLRRKVRKLIR